MDTMIVPVQYNNDNYAYLLLDDTECCVIDAGNADAVMDVVRHQHVSVLYILSTHHHADHIAGNQSLKKNTGCQIVAPDCERIPGIDRYVRDGDTITCGGWSIDVIATPGHTRTGVCYSAVHAGSHEQVLFTGDTLFLGGCGRLLEGTAEQLWSTFERLAQVPGETAVYCGHEYTEENYRFALSVAPGDAAIRERAGDCAAMMRTIGMTVPSTIGTEKRANIFMRAADPAIAECVGLKGHPPADVFAELRQRKDRFK